jgi:aspartate aminotransferase
VVTTGLSKSLALGGWRIGVARLPASALGRELTNRVLAIGSEIWSAPASPVQQAAAFAFTEPPELTEHIARSRQLHACVARAVAGVFRRAGAAVAPPAAAFYVYPDFGPLAGVLRARHGITTDAELAQLLLCRYGVGVLPASAFGEDAGKLRLRVATGLLYGDTEAQREAALDAADVAAGAAADGAGPGALPWIAGALSRLGEVLDDLVG